MSKMQGRATILKAMEETYDFHRSNQDQRRFVVNDDLFVN